ncbi:ParA family protein [Aromatoleum toluclasticum]|uniref:ParA family protein n=1 Tax=Aromatoleum toluclasticum TaxID=92003 RepID=UPI0009FD5589|nr:ParA family protein [Aromatoleum toluclasticum]
MARPDGPIVVCVINLKGGVGKSTIAALLARRAYTQRRKNVLAIDIDPQANLSQALMRSQYTTFLNNKDPSIVEVFAGYRPPAASRRSASSLGASDVAYTVLGDDEISLQLIPSRFDFSDNLTQSVRPDPKVLAKFLAAEFQDKDLIIIDCAPTESVLTHAAYHASGLVLVPVKPEYFATIGFPLLRESLSDFSRRNRGHTIEVTGVVINNGFYHGGNNGGPEKSRALREIRDEATKNGWHVFSREIPFSRGFPKLMRGDNSYSGNADMFYQFANEFFDRIGI